ncbi:MAG: alpha/beta hydrolase [Gammaproteobacteria bacterium]
MSLLPLAWLLSATPARADIDVMNPPGRMVDIGGYSLHIDCRGEGSPTVVMEAGLGGVSLEWLPVQRFLSHYGRVCTYDRAGNGWSDAGPEPRTTSVITDELYRLLNAAGESAPYVLVGHSFGGYTAQMFAERYPNITAGLVLIDSSHPDQVARFLAPPLNLNTAPSKTTGAVVLMSGPPPIPANLPEEIQMPAAMLMTLRKTRMTVAQEYLYFSDSGEEIRHEGQMPAVPMVVITRGIDERSRHHADPKAEMIESVWMQMQDELAAMSPQSAHIVADRSGHHIHLDQPQLVVDAVTMVVDFARARFTTTSNLENGSTWLAFNNATWRSDHLHRQAPNQLPIAQLRQDLAMQSLAGHLAWTHEPRAQRFDYAYVEGEGVRPVSFVR